MFQWHFNVLGAGYESCQLFFKDGVSNFRLNELNKRLSMVGIEMTKEAKFRIAEAARTLTEAQERANHFKFKLELRNVHPAVIEFCDEELKKENYFHAIFENVKSVADRLRKLVGVYADGNPLAELVFSTANPLLKINPLLTDIDSSEHLGLADMIKGLFGLIRNPNAHTPKIKFVIDEAEALDIMNIVSYVHKKLDKAF